MIRNLIIDISTIFGENRRVVFSFLRRVGKSIGSPFAFTIINRTSCVPLFSFTFNRSNVFSYFNFRDSNFIPYLKCLNSRAYALIITVVRNEVIYRRLRTNFGGGGRYRLVNAYTSTNEVKAFKVMSFELRTGRNTKDVIRNSCYITCRKRVSAIIKATSTRLLRASCTFMKRCI